MWPSKWTLTCSSSAARSTASSPTKSGASTSVSFIIIYCCPYFSHSLHSSLHTWLSMAIVFGSQSVNFNSISFSWTQSTALFARSTRSIQNWNGSGFLETDYPRWRHKSRHFSLWYHLIWIVPQALTEFHQFWIVVWIQIDLNIGSHLQIPSPTPVPLIH